MIEDWELEDPELLDNDGEPIREVGERSQRQPIAGERVWILLHKHRIELTLGGVSLVRRVGGDGRTSTKRCRR
jgi:hypothetical protein